MTIRLSPSGQRIIADNIDILGGGLGTIKGVAVNGVAGELQDLTGSEQAACWRRGVQVDVSNASGTLDLDLNTLFPTAPVTLLRIRTTGGAVLRSMNSLVADPQNQEIVIVHERQSGTGLLTIPHNMAGALYAPFFNSNRKPLVLGDVSAYLARGISGFWRSDDTTTSPVTLSVMVPTVAAGALGYVDVSLVGTPFEGMPANAVVWASPQVDLAAAGAGNGGFINCRMSATNTLRFAFVGALAGGAANFTVGSN